MALLIGDFIRVPQGAAEQIPNPPRLGGCRQLEQREVQPAQSPTVLQQPPAPSCNEKEPFCSVRSQVVPSLVPRPRTSLQGRVQRGHG